VDDIRTESIESRRLLAFFAIAFSFTWFFWLPRPLSQMGLIPVSPLTELGFIGAFGPLVAAILVTVAYEGGTGVRALLLRAVDARFAKRWWLAVLILMPAVVLAALLLATLTDGAVPASPVQNEVWMVIPIFFSVLFLSGPFEEEFGWRGYALPRLQARYSALVSSIILGFFWAIWHIPQFFTTPTGMFYKTPVLTFIPTVVAATVLFTWVYNNTNGSLLAMLLLHTTFNLSMYVSAVLDTSLGYVYVLGVFVVAAVVVTVVAGPRELRQQSKDTSR